MALNITSDPAAIQAGQDQQAQSDAQNPAATPTAPTSGNVIGGVPGIAQPQAQTPQATNNAQAVDAVAKMPVSQATQEQAASRRHDPYKEPSVKLQISDTRMATEDKWR